MRKVKITENIIVQKCQICGNNFVPAPQHVYRDKRAPYKKVCSWGCVCQSQRLKEAGIKPRKESKR